MLIILVSVNIINHDSEQVTTEAALGLIGGTMGLLTGFSILSGVEIIYFLIRFISCTILLLSGISSSISVQVLRVTQGPQG